MKWKTLFVAACAAAFAVPAALAQGTTGGGIPSGRVISVNFASGKDGASYEIPADTPYGLVSASGWNNVTGNSGSNVALSVSGASEGDPTASMTFAANATWSYDAEGTDGFLRFFLGDGTHKDVDGATINGATINVTDIPFDNYDVIVYLTTDTANVPFRPVSVNGVRYVGDDSATPWKTAATEDANATFGQSGSATPAYGTNALRVTALSSGDLAIQGSVQVKENDAMSQRCNIAGFQIVEMLPSISVNFAGDASGTHSVPIPETSDAYGLFPVPGSEWKNGFTGTGAIQVSSAYGSAETFSSMLSYKSKNIWYDMGNDTLLQTYLDDGNNGASISMEKVPFTEYAVIVYCAAGNGQPFLPVTVNKKTYTWSDTDNATVEGNANFGSSSVTKPTLGKNALCVTGLTGALTVQGRSGGQDSPRGGIAAIQIICTGDVDASLAPAAETSVVSLNFGSNHGSVPQTADTYGLVPVPGCTWTNISGASSEASGSQTVTVASGKPLTKEPTVDYDSAETYVYNSATDPFLKGYLDDGQRSKGVGASVTVSNLPFWAYDVVVYAGLDETADAALPVRINGTLYTWDSARGATVATVNETAVYGEGAQPTAAYGHNALRVKGLLDYSNELTVQGLPRINQSSQRGGIAAIQIVERKVIQDNNIGDLDPDSNTPVHILPTAQISGDLKLPPDAILDLSWYWLVGDTPTPPITGTLTVNEGTQIRLPKGASWTIAGTIEGADSLADNAVIVDGSLATGVEVNADGTISADATYVWTGDGRTALWSNPYNWSSHTVPNAEADVTIPLDAGAVTIELPAGAVAKSVTITGPESGKATLALTSAADTTGTLTVSGQMLTTGNVTVTQSADITVNGKSTMVCPSGAPQTYPERGAFHVEGAQAEYKVVAGKLSVPTKAADFGFGFTDLDRTAGGFVVVCDNAKLTVGGGNAEAVLSVYSCRMPWPSGYPASGVALAGTVEVLSNGVFETDKNANFAGGPKLVTNGGTVRVKDKESSASVTYGRGYAPTSPLTLSAPEGATLTFSAGESGTLLTGSADVLIKGPGTVALVGAIDAETYTGEISVQENGNLTLADNQRPKLTVSGGASLDVTPSDTERGNGAIVFPTSMMETPNGVTYTVSGLAEGTTVKASVAENTLTLSWEADYPTLSTSVSWSSTENWTNLPEGTSFPSSGSAILDGTKAAITVTLDADLSKMTSIFVKGDVTLVTKGTESTTIPACVALTEEGTTLTIDANFSGAWGLPAGYTLQVNQGFTSFAGLTLEGAVVILEGASGTDGTLTEIGAPRPVEFNGGLTIAASNLTLKSVYNVGTTLALEGDNITIEGNSLFTDNGTEVVNTGTDNAITGVTGLNGSLAVESGSLALTLAGDQPTTTSFLGATIAKDAKLTLAGTSGWFPATGAGTYAVGTNRPQFAVMTVGETLATDIPAKMILSATADEQSAGVVRFLTSSAVTIPAGFVAEVEPYGDAPEWVPAYVRQGTWGIDICNVPAPNGLAGLNDAVALALRQAAAKAGITNGDYTVQLTTGGGKSVEATAAALNDVLGCFTGLTATADAEKTTLTYAYEFGIVGIKRNTANTSWEVTVKVTGAGGAAAGFAKRNVYTVNEETVASPDETQAAQGVVVLPVTGELKEVSVSVARPTEP